MNHKNKTNRTGKNATIQEQADTFNCKFCSQAFPLRKLLRIHERLHCGRNIHKCVVCRKLFHSRANYKKHMLKHVSKNSFKCHVCGKIFPSLRNLNKHVENHMGTSSFKCDICKRSFSQGGIYARHMIAHKHDVYKCEICGKCSVNKSDHWRHTELHTARRCLECVFCGENFFKLNAYKDHLETHTNVFKCDICQETFSALSDKEKHISELHIKKECEDENLQDVKAVDSHINRVILETAVSEVEYIQDQLVGSPHNCHIYPKNFRNLHEQKTNKLNHIDENSEDIPLVSKDEKKHETENSMNSQDSSIKERKYYVCELCSDGFIESSDYVQHMINHIAGNSLRCELCQETFREVSNLKNHKCIRNGVVIKMESPDVEDNITNLPDNCDEQTIIDENPNRIDEEYLVEEIFYDSTQCEIPNAEVEESLVECCDNISYKCEVCDDIFQESSNYKQHIKEHIVNVDNDHGYNFDDDIEVIDHDSNINKTCETENPNSYQLILVNGNETYVINQSVDCNMKCDICGESFSDVDEHNKHLKIHLEELNYIVKDEEDSVATVFECEICGKTFKSARNLRSHKSIHNIVYRYKCEVCEKAFRRQRDYKTHKMIHTGERPYPCDICNKSFLRLSSKLKHMELHKDTIDMNNIEELNEVQSNICELCGESFHEIDDLKFHVHEHLGEPITCDFCDGTYEDVQHYKRHMQEHISEELFVCNICDQTFTSVEGYSKHMHKHINKQDVLCIICGKTFRSSHNLKIHMRIHTMTRPYKCDMCEKTFTQSSSHAIHMRVHTGERPYKCEVCGKSFSQTGHHRTHMRIHTGQRPFKCELCQKTFSDYGNYIKHTRLHTGEQPFKCALCDKGFSRRKRFEIHMRSHETS